MFKINTLLVTVGLPQSGKSTWAKTQPHPIVNPDAIRLAIHGKPFIGLAEPFVWAVALVMVRALFLAGHNVVILDATNTTRKRRDMWIGPGWARRFVTFDTPVDLCKERASENVSLDDEHREGLLAAIERMNQQFQPISHEEKED